METKIRLQDVENPKINPFHSIEENETAFVKFDISSDFKGTIRTSMAILRIIIDYPLVKEKLAFFADYFSYAAKHRGHIDDTC